MRMIGRSIATRTTCIMGAYSDSWRRNKGVSIEEGIKTFPRSKRDEFEWLRTCGNFSIMRDVLTIPL